MPKPGLLLDNGGGIEAHALLADSSAIDAGSLQTPGSRGTACPSTDQRAAVAVARCDIGAYKRRASQTSRINTAPPTQTATSTNTATPTVVPQVSARGYIQLVIR